MPNIAYTPSEINSLFKGDNLPSSVTKGLESGKYSPSQAEGLAEQYSGLNNVGGNQFLPNTDVLGLLNTNGGNLQMNGTFQSLSSSQQNTVQNTQGSNRVRAGQTDINVNNFGNVTSTYSDKSNNNFLTQALGLAADVAPVAEAVATGGTSILGQLIQAGAQAAGVKVPNGVLPLTTAILSGGSSIPGQVAGAAVNTGIKDILGGNSSSSGPSTPTQGGQHRMATTPTSGMAETNPQQGTTASTMGDGGGPPAAASSLAGNPDWASLIGSLGGLYTGLQQAYGSGQGSAAQASKLADPFQGSRQQYAQQMNGLMQDPSSVSTLPGYQFQLNQGLGAIRSAGTIQGSGGAENQQAMQFGQGLASTSYQQEFNNLGTLSGATWGPQAGNAAANQLTQGQATGQKAVMGALAGGSGLINSGVNSLTNGLSSLFNPTVPGSGTFGALPGMTTGDPGATQGGMASAFNGQGISGNNGDFSNIPGYANYGDYNNIGDPTSMGAGTDYFSTLGNPTSAAMGGAGDAAAASSGGDAVSGLSGFFSSLGGDGSSGLSDSFSSVLGSLF